MKKIYLFGLLTLAGTLSAMAAPRSLHSAKNLAIENAKLRGISLNHGSMSRCSVGVETEQPAYYVFNHGNQKGWTIVSGDDRTDDIVGYATEGDFDISTLPAPVLEMLQAHEQYVSGSIAGNPVDEPLRVQKHASANGHDAMGPYLATRWDQYKPYYNNTPLSNGTHCATGCVATAFSQILYYLYYTQGQQESSTFDTNLPSYTGLTNYVTGEAVAGPRTYEWSKMVADYKESYTKEQANAVAKLLSDVGVAVQMKYAVSVSITNSKFVSQDCSTYFGLQNGSSYTYSSSMGASTWQNSVMNELGNYRPVLVASNDHAYVCDGYDGGGYYHFNFGYSGRGDGWYSFSAMNGYGTATWGYTTGLKLRAKDTNADRIEDVCKTARAQSALVPVGMEPGQYRSDLYEALMVLVEKGEEAVANNCHDMTKKNVNDLCTQISQALIALTTYRVPFLTGTYYVKTYTNYSSGKKMAMYAKSNAVNWGAVSEDNDNYKWYLEYNPETNAYQMYNVGCNGHFSSISTSTQARLNTSSTTEVEIRPLAQITRKGKETFACTIRPMVKDYNTGYNYYCHQNSHNDGAGTGGTVVGWEPYSDANQWYFEPIDVYPAPTSAFAFETLTVEIGQSATNELTTNSTGTVTYTSSNEAVATVDADGLVTAHDAGTTTITATIAKTDDFSSQRLTYNVVVPEDKEVRKALDALIEQAQKLYTDDELDEARAASTDVQGDPLFTKASQFTSPYTETSEGKIEYLLDGDASTFWHSKWSGGNVAAGTHYFVLTLDDPITSDILLSMTRRSGATSDHPTQFKIYCSTDGTTFGTDAITIDLPFESAGEEVTTMFRSADECKAMKFVCTATSTSRGYFHMGELQLYPYQYASPTEEQQALVELGDAVAQAQASDPATQQAIDALQAAIDAYCAHLVVGFNTVLAPNNNYHTKKYLENNQIIIEKDGVEYNLNGIRK